jgi:hypothetical protein
VVEAEQDDVVNLGIDIAEDIIDVQDIAGTLKSWVRAMEFPEDNGLD